MNDALQIIKKRFSKDTLLSLATLDGNQPKVRIVDAYYEDGAFYAVTYLLSNKMKEIAKHSSVGVCGEWFSAEGVGENIGHPHDNENIEIMKKLRTAFAAWYDNGHVNEDDKNTCILRIRLTKGVLFHEGKRYDVDFTSVNS